MRPLNIFVPHCSDLLTDHRPHGDGLVANGFIRNLAQRGHNVYVATENVDVREPFPGNVHVTALNKSGRGGFISRLSYMARMRQLYRRHSRTVAFDIIHQLNPVFTGMSLALLGTRTPLILGPYVASWPDDPDAATAALGKTKHFVYAARTGLARIQQRQASALLLTTPAAEHRVPDHQTLSDRIHMLPHGLDTDYFIPPPYPAGASNFDDVLFLSNVVERKGILDLIQAFAQVADEFPRARLVVAGDGPELPASKALAEGMACRNRIVFLGRQTRADSLALLQGCTLFCQPSFGEPFGMSAAEAMSCGKPLIVTDAGGLRYIVDDEGGIQVPVGNPSALAGALQTLLANPSLRRSMGIHNRQRMVEWMSWHCVVERLEGIYAGVLHKSTFAAEITSVSVTASRS